MELGTLGEWVSGMIAGAALLVAVTTQRRQSLESAREEAGSLLADLQVVSYDGDPFNGVVVLGAKITNDSTRSKRSVQLVVGSMMLDEPWNPIGLRPHTDYLRGYDVVSRTSDDRGDGVRAHVRLVEGNAKIAMVVFTREVFGRDIYLLFTDSKNRRWRRDLLTGGLRPAIASDEEQYARQALVSTRRPFGFLKRRQN